MRAIILLNEITTLELNFRSISRDFVPEWAPAVC
jgi:hypothetical protein